MVAQPNSTISSLLKGKEWYCKAGVRVCLCETLHMCCFCYSVCARVCVCVRARAVVSCKPAAINKPCFHADNAVLLWL